MLRLCRVVALAIALTLAPAVQADTIALPMVAARYFGGRVAYADVCRVIDGDTFYVDFDGDGERDDTVRPIGWDAPETTWGKDECYGSEATAQAQALLLGRRVALQRDVSDRGPYDRLLRYTYIISGSGTIWLGAEMVGGGYARAKRYPPDVRHAGDLEALQDAARAHGRGGWAACAW